MDFARFRSPPLSTLTKGPRLTVLTLTTLLAVLLGGAGITKVLGQEMQKDNFDEWELPQTLRPVVGATEVALALLLLVPATRYWGGVLMGPWMLGAIATHLRVGQYPEAIAPLVIGVLGLTVAWLLMPEGIRSLVGRGPARSPA